MDPNPYLPSKVTGKATSEQPRSPGNIATISLIVFLAIFGLAIIYGAWSYYVAERISQSIGP